MAKPKKKKVRKAAHSQLKELEIAIRGSETSVRRALHDMRFVIGWDQGIARQIALDETGVAEATLDDELGSEKIGLISDDARLNYRDQCCERAAKLGHPVPDLRGVECDSDTSIMRVGDTLYASAKP